MRREILKVLEDINDRQLIIQMLCNMNSRDIHHLVSLLDFTDIKTQDKWLDSYSRLFK